MRYLPRIASLILLLPLGCDGAASGDTDSSAEIQDRPLADADVNTDAESDSDQGTGTDAEADADADGDAIPESDSESDDGGDSGPDPLPRIEVVAVPGGEGYFREATSGARFVPRGSNYVRLDTGDGGHHATFRPSTYDRVAVRAALATMARSGYNLVRVFVDPGHWERNDGINGPDDTPGLDGAYLDAMADFILAATEKRLYVMPSLDEFPYNDRYLLELSRPWDPNFEGCNARYMNPGHVRAKQVYLRELIAGLSARIGAGRLTTIFAYELDNELFFDASLLPFRSTTIRVTTADGGTYSMADPAQRQQAADANVVHYANAAAAAIRELDPQAMVTIGAFTYAAVGRAGPNGLLPIPGEGEDPRFPVRLAILSLYSDLSFLDVHTYPRTTGAYDLGSDLASSEWSSIDLSRPVIMGEFGAFKSWHPDLTAAALAMRDHQVASCSFRLGGWLFWTFDTAEQPELWNLMDHEGAINGVLAPVVRPDPCAP